MKQLFDNLSARMSKMTTRTYSNAKMYRELNSFAMKLGAALKQ
ncbi:MAG TPA: hypothetical protein VGW31_03530 [Hanamia sp.]|nr:hypothetical protein [Hanamia sp.]